VTDKYIQALARHERAQQEVKRLKKAIGGSLDLCPIEKSVGMMSGDWEDMIDAGGRIKNHLWHAMREATDDGDYPRLLTKGEIDGYLADAETGCPHCLEAWRLIQQRKVARQELGAAKRVLRALGRAAVKMVEASP
jgi:hypothetical protein